MAHNEILIYSITLVILVILLAFFSCAETSLMSINRYRLRHQARLKKRSAILILKLLKRPDRLLGAVLVGNSIVTIVASTLATLLAVFFFGDMGVVVETTLLTMVILVFAEVAPKTYAALYPERVAKVIAYPIFIMLKVFYPLVWFANTVSNAFLSLLRVKVTPQTSEPLSREELRSIVYEGAGRASHKYQTMLLGILDLNQIVVDDVMTPRNKIIGIDLDENFEKIKEKLSKSQLDWMPVYRENINQISGMLHLRDLLQETMIKNELTQETFLKLLQEPYFIPEGTPLNVQLIHFQRQRKRMAMVVDEYGEIKGLITLEDILEEIVGEFTTNVVESAKFIQMQPDGSYLVDGAMSIRELNRMTHWEIPTDEARTVSGLLVEYLEAIPQGGVCVKIADHPIEIIDVDENMVRLARIFPKILVD